MICQRRQKLLILAASAVFLYYFYTASFKLLLMKNTPPEVIGNAENHTIENVIVIRKYESRRYSIIQNMTYEHFSWTKENINDTVAQWREVYHDKSAKALDILQMVG